jgi:heme oxygenase
MRGHFLSDWENCLSIDAPCARGSTDFGRANPVVFPGRLRRALRAATRFEHSRLDAALSEMELTESAAYGMFLNIHYTALCALQPRWRPADHGDFVALTECARRDLTTLKFAYQRHVLPADAAFNPVGALGTDYVLRGSRLGAAILLARVPAEFPRSYLSFSPAKSWHVFLNELEAFSQDSNPSVDREVIGGAKFAFGIFGEAAAAQLSKR